MFYYKLLVSLGPNANVKQGEVYEQSHFITGVRDNPYLVQEAAEVPGQRDWLLIAPTRPLIYQ
jgi:hypothetical protein